MKHTIYIKLLDGGTIVYRPAQAMKIRENIYKILSSSDYDPEVETWEFKPGNTVRCEWKTSNNNARILVAKQIISSDI